MAMDPKSTVTFSQGETAATSKPQNHPDSDKKQLVQGNPQEPHSNNRNQSRLNQVMIVIITTLAMVGNITAVSIALPTIGRYFDVQPSEFQWVASVYPLSSGCFLLVCGRLADIYGRKKAYLFGMLWLVGFTLGCGFTTNIVILIILRAMQGIGVAACIPASLGILAETFPPSRARSLAFASFSAGAPIGAAFGTVIGGILTQKPATSWRSSFYVLAGINFGCLVTGYFFIDKDVLHPDQSRSVDWIGALLVSLALVSIVFALGQGESAPNKWATAYIISLLVIGVLFLGVFIYWQWFLERVDNLRQRNRPNLQQTLLRLKLPPPIMKLSLWRRANGRFSAMMLISFMSSSAFVSWAFWIQLYFQNYILLSPLQVVVRVIPMFVMGLLCNAFVGFMASRTPMVALTFMGTAGTAMACILMAVINPNVTYWAFIFPSLVFSVLGSDLVYTAGTLYIAQISLPHEQSLGAAGFQTMAQLGNSFGITISTVVFNRVSERIGGGEHQLRSYQAAQWTNSAFGLCGCLVSLVFFWGVGSLGSRKGDSAKRGSTNKSEREAGNIPGNLADDDHEISYV